MGVSIKNLVLLRHGEAQINAGRRKADSSRPQPLRYSATNERSPLTKTGKKQAVAVAKALKKEFGKFDIIFVSPYLRTRQTAALIKKYVPYPKMIVDDKIRERSMGRLELLTHKGVRIKFPGEYRRILREGTYHYRPPNGESFSDVQERIFSFMDDSRLKGNVLIITHGADIACLMEYQEHFPPARLIQINNGINICSATCYSRGRKGLKRRFYNKIYY